MPTADLPSGTVTFLFTDIEGSTRLLKQLRERYGEVLAEHQRLLREAFEEAGGREIDTQGDAFFFAFATAKDGVTAALAGQRALHAHAWPDGVEVKVRMGVHTGEPAALGGERYVGLGVHRAARICAAAHGGQVLLSEASRAVIEDELPADVSLRELGEHRLKDLDRPARLYQLVAPDLPDDFPAPRTGKEETAFAGREGELAEAAQAAVARPRPLRRRTLLLAALAGVLAAAVAIPIFALGQGDGGAEVVVSPNSVAVIDPGSNELVDAVPVGTGASRVAVGEGAVWVLNSEDRTVSRINPDTLEPATIGTGTTPTDLAVGGGSVWLVTGCPDSTIFRLDPGSNQVERLLELRCDTPEVSPSYIAYGDGSLWVANQDEEVLRRIDPEGGAVEAAIPLDAVTAASAGEGIAVGEGAVWVNRAASVVRVDPSTNESRTIDVPHEFGGIAAGEGGVWTADNPITTGTGRNADGTLWRIDPTLEAGVRTIRVGAGPIGVGAGAGSVWVANSQDGTVSRVDPLENEAVDAIEVGSTPRGVAIGEGAVWVTVN